MHRLWRSLPLFFLLLGCTALRADSFDPDLKRLMREAQRPKVDYGPARVGWNGPEVPATPPVNATYESLRMDSPAAIRQELKTVLLPQWHILAALGVMIVGLRLLRNPRDGEEMPGNVIAFPAAPRNEAEAA